MRVPGTTVVDKHGVAHAALYCGDIADPYRAFCEYLEYIVTTATGKITPYSEAIDVPVSCLVCLGELG